MRLHLIALPHTRVAPEFNGCAYTAKALKFTRMMRDHEVILYAPEGSTEETAETVEVISDKDRQRIFGKDDPARLPAWPTNEQADLFNRRATRLLRRRVRRGDLVLLTGGLTHAPIMEVEALYCEPGVGYEGIATGLCAFESHAWRHYVYAKRAIVDGRWFDTVIPNYFDLREFPVPPPSEPGDYLVYLGRVVPRKGVSVALEVASSAGLPLLVAGAGVTDHGDGWIVAGEGTPDEVRLAGDVRYVGPVTVEERAALLSGARALLAPTTYIEPFGGVAVEAMLCGTPAITSDWGAFTETVEQGVTGFRFSTLREGVDAVEHAAFLPRDRIRARAAGRYSLESVAPMFEEWFGRLLSLYQAGWYEMTAPAAIMQA